MATAGRDGEGAPPRRRLRGEVFIHRERCKGCAFCVEFCPSQALALDKAFNRKGYHPPVVVKAEACNGCDLCGMYCPDFAIHGVRVGAGVDDEG
ncbi:MAG TPA: 4Fe-4S binding protein [Myxococcota bacterium]|nr:4Fe-4S binding protein [Myxococcota bacterium]HRY96526.1 4Fe-4S binding protein [Myxococcota bacterium]HSA24748.1 4Fe-4S binding protein [Myxococcota bacterium]